MGRTDVSDDRRRVLVLEDDSSIAELLSWVLSEAGYEVTCAVSLQDARQACLSIDPDVIIADLLLPDGLGTDLIAELRHSRNGQAPPSIVMSALPQARQHADAAGALVCLSKPFDLAELLGEISRISQPRTDVRELQV